MESYLVLDGPITVSVLYSYSQINTFSPSSFYMQWCWSHSFIRRTLGREMGGLGFGSRASVTVADDADAVGPSLTLLPHSQNTAGKKLRYWLHVISSTFHCSQLLNKNFGQHYEVSHICFILSETEVRLKELNNVCVSFRSNFSVTPSSTFYSS